ncbi:Zinc finger protein [Globisporangium polare]
MSGYPIDHQTMQAQLNDTASSVSSGSEDDSVSETTATTSQAATTPTNSTPTARADRERTFLCPEPGCDGRFHRKFTLREHLKTHTGEKPYQCAVQSCGKLFSTSGNLSRHRRLHMLTRIKCPILDCARVFTKQEKLLRHLKVHMGSAAHACSYPACAKTFSTSGNLSRHIRTQHRGESRTANRTIRMSVSTGSTSSSWSAPSSASSSGSFQPSMMSLLSMPVNDGYYSAPPTDQYSQPFHHQRPQFQQSQYQRPAPEQQTTGRQEGILETDIMVLLDCLFVNDGSNREGSAPAQPRVRSASYAFNHSSSSSNERL